MTMNIAELEQALLALDRQDRAEVIARALESLERQHVKVTPDEVDSAWATEVQRRIDEVENGTVQLLNVDESHAQLRAELIARRQ